MSFIYQLKSIFVRSCPNCGKRYSEEMKNKSNAGYNVTCDNCEVYIENVV